MRNLAAFGESALYFPEFLHEGRIFRIEPTFLTGVAWPSCISTSPDVWRETSDVRRSFERLHGFHCHQKLNHRPSFGIVLQRVVEEPHGRMRLITGLEAPNNRSVRSVR